MQNVVVILSQLHSCIDTKSGYGYLKPLFVFFETLVIKSSNLLKPKRLDLNVIFGYFFSLNMSDPLRKYVSHKKNCPQDH